MRTLFSLGTLALALSAHAGTLTYNFQIQTSEGYDVHQIMMYASNGAGQDDIYFNPVTVPASGVFQLQHTVGFEATEAMIVGVMQRNQDSNMDLVMWVSDSFASSVLGMRYTDVFPNGATGPNPGHNAWPALIAAAAGGDAGSLSTLYDFFRRAHTYNPLFHPSGSYSIIEFSVVPPPIGEDIPEPATWTLVGAAGLALWVRARRG